MFLVCLNHLLWFYFLISCVYMYHLHCILTFDLLSIESIRDITTKYDNEIHRLKHVNSKLEANISEVRETLSPSSGFEGPGAVFSSVGQHFKKSLARKINSTMSASNDSLHEIEEPTKVRTTSTSKYVRRKYFAVWHTITFESTCE